MRQPATSPRLRYRSRLGPDDLPTTVAPFIQVSVPIVSKGHVLSLNDDFELRLVSNQCRLAIQPNFNRAWLPHAVVDVTGRDPAKICSFEREPPSGLIS